MLQCTERVQAELNRVVGEFLHSASLIVKGYDDPARRKVYRLLREGQTDKVAMLAHDEMKHICRMLRLVQLMCSKHIDEHNILAIIRLVLVQLVCA